VIPRASRLRFVSVVANEPDIPDYCTPTAWYRADRGIVLNGGDVQEWRDQSGNGIHLSQPNASYQPAFEALGWNGNKPAVLFNAEYLRNDGGIAPFLSGEDLPFSVFCCYQIVTYGSSDYLWAATRNVATGNGRLALYESTSDTARAVDDAAASKNETCGTSTLSRTLVTIINHGTTWSTWRDGVPKATAAACNLGVRNLHWLTLGGLVYGVTETISGSSFSYMRCAEFLICNSDVSANRTAIEAIMKARNGGLP